MAQTHASVSLPLNQRIRSAMDKGLLLAFILFGTFSIPVLKLSGAHVAARFGIPVAIILIYAGFTVFRTRFRLRYDQAGDNCYYMGFIFTLVSLGVALYQIQAQAGLQTYVVEVIRDFGLALITTITGIIARVFLNQLREDPADFEESARNELLDQSRILSAQLRGATIMMDDVRRESADKLKNFVFVMQQVADEHQERVSDLRAATTKLAKSVQKLAEDLGSAEIPTGELKSAAADTVSVLNDTARSIGEIDRIGKALAEQLQSIAHTSAEAARQTSLLSDATGKNIASAEAATASFGRFTLSLDRIADQLSRSTTALAAAQDTFAQSLRAQAQWTPPSASASDGAGSPPGAASGAD